MKINYANNDKTHKLKTNIDEVIGDLVEQVYYLSNWTPEEIKETVVISTRDKIMGVYMEAMKSANK